MTITLYYKGYKVRGIKKIKKQYNWTIFAYKNEEFLVNKKAASLYKSKMLLKISNY